MCDKTEKILVFGMTENPGGVESVIMNYYRNIDHKILQFDFLCNTKEVAYEDEIISMGGKIYRITPRYENRKQFSIDLDNFFQIHAKEYHCIWVNVCSLANIDYLKFAKKYGIQKRIIHSHNSRNMDSKIRGVMHHLNKMIIQKYATDFWACSNAAAKWFYSRALIKKHEIIILNNAIDTEKFVFNQKIRNQKREELKIKDELVVGHIGRFHFQKNHKFIIEVFHEMLKINNNMRLILVGDGEEKESIEKLVETYQIKEKVDFLGLRNDVPELMQAFDLMLFPSLFEGLALVLVEAQAASLPIYTSQDKVVPESKMTKYLKFISLDQSAKEWAFQILHDDLLNNKRCKDNQGIIDKGYDITCEVNKLMDKLLS